MTAKTVPQRVKERSEVLRLNAQGWYVEKIANDFKWNRQTVRETIHRGEINGLGGLFLIASSQASRVVVVSDRCHVSEETKAS